MSEPVVYRFEVRIVVLLENGTWIAQGLDYDITGHGSTTQAALENFGKTLIGQALVDLHHGEQPLASTPKAPRFYWKKFDEAQWRGEQQRFGETPPAYMISALATDTRIAA